MGWWCEGAGDFGGGRDDSGNSEDLGQYLGSIYKDEIAGIKIAPPAGSRVINRAGLDLVSFVNDAKQWGGSVRMSIVKDKMTVDDYLSSTVQELGRSFRGVQVLESRDLTFQGHKAGRLSASMEADMGAAPGQGKGQTVALYRQQLIVQMGDNQFIVLMLYVPLKDRDSATTTFNAMVGTFEILDQMALAKKRAEGAAAGKEWLTKRTADGLRATLNPQPQYFRVKVGGADIGFLRFDEIETNREATKGIQVTVTSRTFNPDGSGLTAQNVEYWAYSGALPPDRRSNYSAWTNTAEQTMNQPNIPAAKQTFWVRELGTSQIEGISRFSPEELADLQKQREEMLKDKNLPSDKIPPPIEVPVKQYHVHVNFEGDNLQAAKPPFDARITMDHPAVLLTTLEYLWPRGVDLSKPSQMVFVVYSTTQKKLVFRTLSVEGKDHIVINKQGVDCVKCLDEMDPASTTMWVDKARGRF